MNSQDDDVAEEEEEEEEDNEDAEVAAPEEAEDEEQADTLADASVDDGVRGGLASKKTRSLSKSPASSAVEVRFPPDVLPLFLFNFTSNPALLVKGHATLSRTRVSPSVCEYGSHSSSLSVRETPS